MKSRAEAGFTLIEVLIALMIVGIAVTIMLGGLAVATRASGSNKQSTDARTLLTATAEQIEKASYVGCPAVPASAYTSARQAVVVPATGGTVDVALRPTILDFSIWDGTAFVGPSGAACTYDQDATAYSRMQRITLLQGSDTLTMVKRGP